MGPDLQVEAGWAEVIDFIIQHGSYSQGQSSDKSSSIKKSCKMYKSEKALKRKVIVNEQDLEMLINAIAIACLRIQFSDRFFVKNQ